MKKSYPPLLHTILKHGLIFSSLMALGACQNSKQGLECTNCLPANTDIERSQQKFQPAIICQSPERYSGTVVGTGHCVSLIKECANISHTSNWRPGAWVSKSNIQAGSVIATFREGRYPNSSGYHAAIFISHDDNGIWVWDQWIGKSVHKRHIRYRDGKAAPANSAEAYRLVLD